jgi:hypothetical protein
MHVMVYSRLARLAIEVARALVKDLLRQPVTDDLLLQVRGRLLAHADWTGQARVIEASDFSTLTGTYDLVRHRHEDAFDVAQIAIAIRAGGMYDCWCVRPRPATT